MASDLLSTIRREIDERLSELRPLLAEQEQLLVAADALAATDRGDSAEATSTVVAPKRARRGARSDVARRGSPAGAIKLAASNPAEAEANGKATNSANGAAMQLEMTEAKKQPARPRRSTAEPKPERAARGAVREAILAALEHGSHTVGELAVVTAMTGPSINGNLRRLVADGTVAKTEREGKAAWALTNATA
jgi:DNA-binding transcriptional ArsR family regulator